MTRTERDTALEVLNRECTFIKLHKERANREQRWQDALQHKLRYTAIKQVVVFLENQKFDYLQI